MPAERKGSGRGTDDATLVVQTQAIGENVDVAAAFMSKMSSQGLQHHRERQ